MPNNNNFGVESEGSVFCTCDDISGVELVCGLESSRVGRDGLGLEVMTRGFGL